MLSVILPAYNEELMIEKAARILGALLSEADIAYELIFVDDGSRDRTWEQIQRAAQADRRVRGVSFSRNFGKEAAMFAGLSEAEGDCCAVMDCDLQHPPEKLVEMYRLWEQGFEVVEGVKIDRGQENAFYGLGAKIFYSLISRAAGFDMSQASDFKLLDRKAVNSLLTIREKHAFFRALSSWVGFRTARVEYQVQPRTCGSSKWSTRALFQYAFRNITSFSTAPMQIITFLGAVMLLISAALGSLSLYQKLTGAALDGFTTVIIIQLFTGSIIMISLGLIGYYIARIYEEVKGRPRYIISKKC